MAVRIKQLTDHLQAEQAAPKQLTLQEPTLEDGINEAVAKNYRLSVTLSYRFMLALQGAAIARTRATGDPMEGALKMRKIKYKQTPTVLVHPNIFMHQKRREPEGQDRQRSRGPEAAMDLKDDVGVVT